MAQKTSWTGQVLTESLINTYLMHEGGAWTSWTPVVTQSNTPTLSLGRRGYTRASRRIKGDAVVTITGTGTAANIVRISLPVATAAIDPETIIGHGYIYDSNLDDYHWGTLVCPFSTSTCSFQVNTNGAAAAYLGSSSFTTALANNDILSIWFDYEAAS